MRDGDIQSALRGDRFGRALDVTMALLAVGMLGIALVDLAIAPDAPVRRWLDLATWVIWGAFALEFGVKLALAEDRRRYLQTHWFDVLVVLLPMFRVFQALSVMAMIPAVPLPLLQLTAFIGRGMQGLWWFLRVYQIGYLIGLTAVVTVTGALAVSMLERGDPVSPLRTLGDALWWSAALMTTIGSELAPLTTGGRLVALAMELYAMIVAVYLIGAVSAHLLARWAETPAGTPPAASPAGEPPARSPAVTFLPPVPGDADQACGPRVPDARAARRVRRGVARSKHPGVAPRAPNASSPH